MADKTICGTQIPYRPCTNDELAQLGVHFLIEYIQDIERTHDTRETVVYYELVYKVLCAIQELQDRRKSDNG